MSPLKQLLENGTDYRDESFASKTGLTLKCRNFGLTSLIHLVAASSGHVPSLSSCFVFVPTIKK